MRRFVAACALLATTAACSLPFPDERPDAWVQIDPGPWQDTAYDRGPQPEGVVGDDGEPLDAGPDDGCTPLCWGKVCGDDGCDGVCGLCPAGTVCSTDGGLCISQAVQKPFGAGCLPDERCGRFIRDPWHDLVYYNPSWPVCLGDQCAGGLCVMGACSRSCTMGKDAVHNDTGAPGGDGIEDDGEGGCGGARDDVFAGGFTCTEPEMILPQMASTSARCVPRSSFARCDEGEACPAGEWCGFLPLEGELQARCLAAPAGGLPLGAACGSGMPGDTARCASSACSDFGCTTPCFGAGPCPTPGARCVAGACEGSGAACEGDADCSAWECREGVRLADVNGLFTACAPRACEHDGDCRDAGFFCTHHADTFDPLRWKTVQLCEPRLEGGAATGEPCRGAGDGLSPVPCADRGYCFDGRCGAACRDDGDCPAAMTCAVRELPLDLDGDAVADGSVGAGRCLWVGDPGTPCEVPGDCPSGACTAFAARAGAGAEVRLACAEPPAGALPPGSPCGAAAFGGTCGSRLCLGEDADHGVAGYCSVPCRTDADCPADLAVGPDPKRWVCAAVRLSTLGTSDREDDLYGSWCVAVPGDSSLAPCGPGPGCDDPAEVCRAYARSGPPSAQDQVSFRCVRPEGGLPPGGACDPGLGGADCATGSCAPTAFAGIGFCTFPCAGDADCGALAGGGARCMPRVVLPRKAPGTPIAVPECRLPDACLACADDTDCAPGHRCVDLSGNPWAQEYRCSPACDDDMDCAVQAPGSTCGDVYSSPLSGSEPTAKVCAPLVCP